MRSPALPILVLSCLSSLSGCTGLSGLFARPASREPSVTAETRRNERYAPGNPGYVTPPPLSPAAEALAGKVVFTRTPAKDGAEAQATMRLGDPLYLRFVTDDAPYNARPHCNSDSPRRLDVRATLTAADGSTHRESLTFVGLGDEASRARVDASPTGDVSVASVSDWSKEVSQLTPAEKVARKLNVTLLPHVTEGDNKLAIAVSVDCTGGHPDDPVLASGELTLTVKPGDKKAYLAKYGTHLQPATNPKLAALAPEIKALFETDKHGAEKGKTLGVRVVSPAWTKRRNELTGIVVKEWINAAVVVRPAAAKSDEACELYWLSVEREPGAAELEASALSGPTPFVCMNATK